MVINGTNESPRRTERRQLAQCIQLTNNDPFFIEIINQSPKSTERSFFAQDSQLN